jgi:hypothetical protein
MIINIYPNAMQYTTFGVWNYLVLHNNIFKEEGKGNCYQAKIKHFDYISTFYVWNWAHASPSDIYICRLSRTCWQSHLLCFKSHCKKIISIGIHPQVLLEIIKIDLYFCCPVHDSVGPMDENLQQIVENLDEGLKVCLRWRPKTK